ncbi:P-loop containing nucleoside triphosphate hydrolase [Phytophthora cactorum]|nr:P-loop containing nucleoside triphosphate hydrolase [Phytophthora cactorum]
MLNGGLERFYKKYNHLSRKINLQLPTPEVRFQDLSFSVEVPATAGSHNTQALRPMTGIIKPGSMTLILANPGAGNNSFKKEIGGEILYSGFKGEEIELTKLVGLVDQTDNHIPTLTVRETFKFADLTNDMRDIAALRTELFLQILGLESCADTVVGTLYCERVTVGEVLVGGQSLFLCDEISTGLDSAATFDIMKALLRRILMIHEGYMVYHGPRVDILDYLGPWLHVSPRVDPADFLIEVTSGRGQRYANGNVEVKDLPSSIFKKTLDAISKGFNEHQFESAEDFKKAQSVVNLARSKDRSEFGLALSQALCCC